jgi:hypothetical protein
MKIRSTDSFIPFHTHAHESYEFKKKIDSTDLMIKITIHNYKIRIIYLSLS